MKKVLLALCVIALVACSASALDLRQGDMWMHLTDGTTLWTTEFGALAPRAPSGVTPPNGFVLDGIAIGDESRSVMNVDSFEYVSPPDSLLDDGELTGLVYDLIVADYQFRVNPLGQTLVDIYFTGGILDLYYDPTPEGPDEGHVFNPAGDGLAPLQWDVDGVGTNTYTNINDATDDATLWLSCAAIPISPSSAITGVTTINLTLGTGSNPLMYMDITGGSAASMFDTGIGVNPQTGALYDLSMGFTVYNPTSSVYSTYSAAHGGWQLASDDPIHAFVIPEPATLTLLGLGIAGLGLGRKRKKQ